MTIRSFKAMADRVARRAVAGEDDVALMNVDQAVDAIIASLIALDENLPNVVTDTVPQKAAVDEVRDLLNEAVKPYFADVVKALQVFDR
jgi:hypothetical protein